MGEAKSRAGLIRRIAANVALLAAGTLSGLLAGEIAMRVFLPNFLPSTRGERSLFSTYDAHLGWRSLPNFSGKHERYDFSVFVHQNQYGLRGPDTVKLEKDPAIPRIVVLGDSYVWGFGVDQNEVFSDPQVHGSAAELLNFGVSGYGTDQEYLLYLRDGARFKPDEVILVLNLYNDIENNLEKEQYDYPKPYFSIDGGQLQAHTDHIQEKRLRTLKNALRSKSRVINLMLSSAASFQERLKTQREESTAAAVADRFLDAGMITPADREGVLLTGRIVTALRDAVVKQGAAFSVIFVPYKPHILGAVEHNHPLAPLLAEEFHQAGVAYYEPYPLFLAAHQRGEATFNALDNHFNAAGHRLLAQIVTDAATRASTANHYRRAPAETAAPVPL